uniref:protein-serine/threonine phosphatase n=1 Tax=Araucaria cunninghamii TaxID=56994 RepID=A0A0D6R5Q7_ARACU
MAGESFNSTLFHGDICLGEVNILPQYEDLNLVDAVKDVIRISHLSPSSERCPPLAVLHTITSGGVFVKMELKEPQLQSDQSPLKQLYTTCLREAKTAIVPIGGKELHLVAMLSKSRRDQMPCFWGYYVPSAMYNACLGMLNLRCLAIVFDLDETLIVANTLRSFEDRIDALQRKITAELDPQRVHGMLAELKRYQEDKVLLKQYADTDQIFDSGRIIRSESEVVPPLSDKSHPIVRPLIRLPDRNMILTRINPNVRDTSVLVRLRPAWDELRTYLTFKGRKRFEVYICTMSERDYALEMWRLLDGEARLIHPGELFNRVLCVKPGLRKSLINVFHDGICHPKMAMVIDDRLKVWEDKDQPRVHVVPAFAPYYAPQAETSCAVPVLCVARNVACNVRGGFFKDFDEGLLQRIAEVFYEADIKNLPPAPDVSNYLMSDDDQNVNRDLPLPEGMADSEVERRLNPQESNAPMEIETTSNGVENQGLKIIACPPDQLPIAPLSSIPGRLSRTDPSTEHIQEYSHGIQAVKPFNPQTVNALESNVQGSPIREEGEVPESELDPDTRRRLLILQHGQDTGKHSSPDPPLPIRPVQLTLPPAQAPGGWLGAEEEMSPRELTRPSQGLPIQPDSHSFENRLQQPPFYHGVENSLAIDRCMEEPKRRPPDEGFFGDDRVKNNHIIPDSFSHSEDEESSMNRMPSNFNPGGTNAPTLNSVGALQEIASKCGTKVEFNSLLDKTMELQFTVEVLFSGEKVGAGIGRTKKEAQIRAADDALRYMASQYMSQPVPLGAGAGRGQTDSSFHAWSEDEGLRETCNSMGFAGASKEDDVPVASTSGQSKYVEQRLSEDSKRSYNAIDTLKEMCTMEGLSLVFIDPEVGVLNRKDACARVDVAGQILGKGSGPTWEAAKLQAAEEALRNFKSTFSQCTQKRLSSPRLMSVPPNKRLKITEISRGAPRIPPSPRRYAKNGPPIP